MKKFIRDYLTFHRSEKRGIVVLLSIIVILILYLNFSYLLFPQEKIDFTSFEKRIKSFSDSLKQQNDSLENESKEQKHFTSYSKEDKPLGIKGERFNFNPNNLPDKDWKRLGFSDKQIHVFDNYQAKGGRFRSKADVKMTARSATRPRSRPRCWPPCATRGCARACCAPWAAPRGMTPRGDEANGGV